MRDYALSHDPFFFFFFFNDTATTEIYTLSLHDALPICTRRSPPPSPGRRGSSRRAPARGAPAVDRKSTRLNSSHLVISYAVFCLKKKKSRGPSLAPGHSSRSDRAHGRRPRSTDESPEQQ